MSLIKTIRQQLGLSVTPANNFTLDASADNGTMKLARGNAGATTQDIMTVDAAGKVSFPQGIDYPEPTIFNVTCSPEAGTFGPGAVAYIIEAVVGNLVTLTIAWDIPDKGTGTGAVIIGYSAAGRGFIPFDNRFWAVGSGRSVSGKGLQVLLNNGYIAVFNYDNTGAVENGYTNRGSLQFITSGK